MNVPRLRFKDFIGEWEVKKLDSIADLTSSKRVYLSDYVNEGIPFYRGKEISELKRNVKPKDILYITREAYEAFKSSFGVPQVNDILITAVGTLGNVYRIKNDSEFYFKDGNLIWLKGIKISSSFLEILLETNQEIIQKSSIGSSQRALTIVELKKLKFKIPSLPEQTKIANFLMAIDEKISQLTQKYDLLKQYKKGVMQQIFSQKLRFKDDDGREFPEWEVKTLAEANIQIIDGDRGENYPNGDDFTSEGHCLFLNAKNVTKYGFIFNEVSFISKQKDNTLRKGKLIRGDLVITTRGTVGNIAYFDEKTKYENIRINSGMVVIRNNNSYISPNYLYKFFSSTKFKNALLQIAFGSAQPQLTVTEINKLRIQLPAFVEQTKIANFFTAIDDKITHTLTQLDAVKLYKKGLLQQLFV